MPRRGGRIAGRLFSSLTLVIVRLCAVVVRSIGASIRSAVALPKNNSVLSPDNGSCCFLRISEKNLLLAWCDGDLDMQITAFSNWDEIAPHTESWDRLACGVPFRTWAWLSSWWRHYGPQSPDDLGT